LYLLNNIFSNKRAAGGTGKHYAISIYTLPSVWSSDYNDLYSASVPMARWETTDLDDLPAWQAYLYDDLNSVSVDPAFVSATDLHTYQPALDNLGLYIWGIIYDLEGNPITNPPDMGCYQFSSGPGKTLNLTLFLEGLYAGSGVMNPAVDGNTGLPQWGATIADQIYVQLHESFSPFDAAGSEVIADLNTDGTASATISGALTGDYYIAVLHRNSVETWSAVPVSFALATADYDFSDLASKAFGDNMIDMGGVFAFYSGDANADGAVDGLDMIDVDNQVAAFATGYLSEDINGDGSVDALDMILLDNNSAAFVSKIIP
jgi:hypothetical protein